MTPSLFANEISLERFKYLEFKIHVDEMMSFRTKKINYHVRHDHILRSERVPFRICNSDNYSMIL